MSQQPSSTKQSTMSRRRFMQTAAATSAAVALGTAPRLASGANDRLGIGVIGAGGRGLSHLRLLDWMQEHGGEPIELIAICDVYRPRLKEAAEGYNIKGYMDYRELLADPAIDVVCIASPDHHHGQQAIDAIKAGKHVYCEKPVTHWRQYDVIKRLAETVKQSDRTFQLGTQAMSDSAWHQMKKLVQDGAIGKPLFGETGFFRTGDWGERGMPIPDPNAKPGADLNWEAFLGDAPQREFSLDRFFRWRLFKDYAGGPVTDLYPHSLTQVVDIMGLGFPETVVATGGIHRYPYELREVPDTFNLLATFPEGVTVSLLGTQGNDYQATGSRGSGQRIPVIRGWEGSLTIESDEIVLTYLREAKKKPQRFKIETNEDQVNHWKNLFDCIRAGKQNTWSDAQLAHRVQTTLIMAAWSLEQGKVAHFDQQAKQIVI